MSPGAVLIRSTVSEVAQPRTSSQPNVHILFFGDRSEFGGFDDPIKAMGIDCIEVSVGKYMIPKVAKAFGDLFELVLRNEKLGESSCQLTEVNAAILRLLSQTKPQFVIGKAAETRTSTPAHDVIKSPAHKGLSDTNVAHRPRGWAEAAAPAAPKPVGRVECGQVNVSSGLTRKLMSRLSRSALSERLDERDVLAGEQSDCQCRRSAGRPRPYTAL